MRKSIIGIAVLMLLLVGCPGTKPSTPGKQDKQEDANTVSDLRLVSIEIHGVPVPEAELGKETWSTINVDNDKATLLHTNIIAKFDYGKLKAQPLAVKVSNPNLAVGDNEVTLTVVATKDYKAWTHKVKINRKADNNPQEDPDLRLVSIKIHGVPVPEAELGKETWSPITVDNAKATLSSTDIQAEFDYGTVKADKNIEIKVDKTDLGLGSNVVTLTVPAAPKKHKRWTHKVTINRGAGGTDVHFALAVFKVKVSVTPVKWELSNKQGDGKFVVEVPHNITRIEKADVEAYFTWDGIANPNPRKIDDFTVDGNFPITFADMEQEKDITLRVAENIGGVDHPEWHGKVTIKKRAKPELKKIKLVSKFLPQPVEITNFTPDSHDLGAVDGQSINVFFYKDISDVQEDSSLIDLITTEPALEKKGTLKIWKLNAENNTLKVKVDGQLKYTITARRKPVVINQIALAVADVMIAQGITEGQNITTSESSVSIIVRKTEGYLYDGVSATLGGQTVAFKTGEPDNPDEYVGDVSLQDGANSITVKIRDISNVEALALVRTFTVTKTLAPQQSDGPTIEKLHLGYGAMAKEGQTKFEAKVNPSKPTEYTVDVNEQFGKKPNVKISLIVKAGAGATDAEVSDVATTEKGVANGVTVFKSNADFRTLASGNVPYQFTLSKGGKTATYTVKLNCTVKDIKHEVTVNQLASGGEIKVWRLSGYPVTRVDITQFPYQIKTGEVIYIELVAASDKKPTKLVISGVEYKDITNKVSKQTPGSLAVKISPVFEDLTISGEVQDK